MAGHSLPFTLSSFNTEAFWRVTNGSAGIPVRHLRILAPEALLYMSMLIDPENPTVALCAAGVAVEGDAERARELFARAWEARRDDFDAAIAAHYVARHQPDDDARLEWNARAVSHAEAASAAGDARVVGLRASLYLNLGDSLLAVGWAREAFEAATRAQMALSWLPDDGYGRLVGRGVAGLIERVRE